MVMWLTFTTPSEASMSITGWTEAGMFPASCPIMAGCTPSADVPDMCSAVMAGMATNTAVARITGTAGNMTAITAVTGIADCI